MDAKITYLMQYLPHPFNERSRKEGVEAWTLIKVVRPEIGPSRQETVAMFNFDSEAELFMAHVFALGLDKKLVEIDPQCRELYEAQRTRNMPEYLR